MPKSSDKFESFKNFVTILQKYENVQRVSKWYNISHTKETKSRTI